ncbi:Biopolymer transport protein ExbD/TolR [Desulfonatronospira thiodismutans ASO3-1]|uniref:Biopolymer transport protein ExbD/TolR n=1 Tax=Desulfonatronospira thiodismutans ASO3-1 TaxID=555779 RepID=D6SL69_9BACT|nr:biopolymer transporter ExbD [Desulfonatronospira thiodismutans]EFI35430.1 Biopolymer transport protein ExbD/TolR [Desulfonatronospira thiodismutans ASO3-1]
MKLNRPLLKQARIEMLPLIDIIFLVLVVFIYAMLSMAVHRSLPVDLPLSSAVEIDPDVRLTITVQADRSIYLDKEPVNLDELTSLLQDKVAAGKDPEVTLVADQDLVYQQLFAVLDRIKEAGIANISLQAEEASQP